jgi:hypothetical protein
MSGSQVIVPQGDEDPIERCRLCHRGRRFIEIGLHEARSRRQPKLGGEFSRSFYCRARKVEPYDFGTALRQRQAIATEVTLQMQDAKSAHIAELVLLDLMQVAASGAQRREIVATWTEMHSDALIPVRPVRLSLHPASDMSSSPAPVGEPLPPAPGDHFQTEATFSAFSASVVDRRDFA